MWDREGCKAYWSVLGATFSVIRDNTMVPASLGDFLREACPELEVTDPDDYLEEEGWKLTVHPGRVFELTKLDRPDVLDILVRAAAAAASPPGFAQLFVEVISHGFGKTTFNRRGRWLYRMGRAYQRAAVVTDGVPGEHLGVPPELAARIEDEIGISLHMPPRPTPPGRFDWQHMVTVFHKDAEEDEALELPWFEDEEAADHHTLSFDITDPFDVDDVFGQSGEQSEFFCLVSCHEQC